MNNCHPVAYQNGLGMRCYVKMDYEKTYTDTIPNTTEEKYDKYIFINKNT